MPCSIRALCTLVEILCLVEESRNCSKSLFLLLAEEACSDVRY
jgi:hypothetical protein